MDKRDTSPWPSHFAPPTPLNAERETRSLLYAFAKLHWLKDPVKLPH